MKNQTSAAISTKIEIDGKEYILEAEATFNPIDQKQLGDGYSLDDIIVNGDQIRLFAFYQEDFVNIYEALMEEARRVL